MEKGKNNIMADNYIGIDPDVEKNGHGFYAVPVRGLLFLYCDL